jgi:diguanylate cyclase (GGDEF)-like protein
LEVQRLELFDGSTRVLSWDAFNAFGRAVISHATRRGDSLSLLLINLDEATPESPETDASLADLTLRVVANVLTRTVRGGDFVGRHGPRSFAVIAQDAQRAGALRLAERIQGALPNRLSVFEGATAFTVSFGIAPFPQTGSSLNELIENAEEALAESMARGGNCATLSSAGIPPESESASGLRRTLEGLERERYARLPEMRAEALSLATRAFEAGETDGIVLKPGPGACSACLDAARDIYRPDELPGLPLTSCTNVNGCRCSYAAAPIDPRHRPPPIHEVGLDTADIPRAWRDAARFGAASRNSCKAEDLAAYLDAFPLLPVPVRQDLEAGEVAYLVRPVRQGWEGGVRAGGVAALGPLIPLSAPFGAWIKTAPRPGPLPDASVKDGVEATLYLTNWRLLLVTESRTDFVLLADVSGIEYFRDALVCTLGHRPEHLVLNVHDALQVGLYIGRAIRTISHWLH